MEYNLQVMTATDFLLGELEAKVIVDDQLSYTIRTMKLVDGVTIDIYNNDECTLRIGTAYVDFRLNNEVAEMLLDWDYDVIEFLDVIQRNHLKEFGN
ncbi:hypothetical protein JOD03_002543 [Chryseomicrobium aureum]|uniref:hypothetical protein n=1 Tax=Chryseomicrobium aureum TaxID=1441723 RepID=UPI00195F1714|nr:hypothetical protein [Chryseomicrobium aureum]MBM7707596.1 hypothetical protein [Chryseomicrobium aureum]